MTGRGQTNPRRANGHRRDHVVARVKREESDCWLCLKPVDKTLTVVAGKHGPRCKGDCAGCSPHPLRPEVDEVVRVADGGSPFDRSNCRLSHRRCNRYRDVPDGGRRRRVLLICGAPGAGKTTHALASGLMVYDLDDAQWSGSDRLFRDALRRLSCQPDAQAAVIRSAATLEARNKAATLCAATECVVIDTDLPTCIERITSRNRTTSPIRAQIAAAQMWWQKYEPGLPEMVTKSGFKALTTSRSW